MTISPAAPSLDTKAEKLVILQRLISESKTFSGVDLRPLPFYTRWKNEEQDYIRIQHEGKECYLPKTQRGRDMEAGADPKTIAGFKHRWNSPYDARGIEFNAIEPHELAVLQETFGSALSVQASKNGRTHSASLFTHIDKKSAIELATERLLTAAGATVAAPGLLISAGALALSKALPIGVALAGVGAAASVGVGAVASVGAGALLAGVPKLLDKAGDLMNGDERLTALAFAQAKLEGKNPPMLTQVASAVPVVAPVAAPALAPTAPLDVRLRKIGSVEPVAAAAEADKKSSPRLG